MNIRNKGETNIISNIIISLTVIILIGIQIVVGLFLLNTTSVFASYSSILFEIIKISAVLFIIYNKENPAYKIAWIVFILLMPIPGIVLYLLYGNTKLPKSFKKKFLSIELETKNTLKRDEELYQKIKKQDANIYKQLNYITSTTQYPLYDNTKVEYINSGEKYFAMLLDDLKKAKKYILLEYFIISKGKLWDTIFEVLKEKSAQGVRVCLITDDFGSLIRYPKHFKKNLKKAGIEYRIFNPITPILSAYLNYRDHRKITVIDGNIAYSGGINIGDEYINLEKKLGHWKDTGIKVEGDAVLNYTLIFLKMFNISNFHQCISYSDFIPIKESKLKTTGYVLPFGDGPDNPTNPAGNTYIQVINNAKDYVYITSPYLIVDNETITALVNTAKAGVDVRIIVPFIGDKWFVHLTTKSFYDVLLEAGVKIYEYKPGFIHSKVFVSDDICAIVGTINLDFRSLYLHYECGAYLYDTKEELVIKQDFLETQEKCIEINLEKWRKRSFIRKIFEALLRAFSPMM